MDHDRPITIAPAPAGATSISANTNGGSELPKMLYACQQCANRKIKCDKAAPICSSCRKGRLECIYQAPPPRRRKRKLSGDGSERLARYERILRQHDLLPPEDDVSPFHETTPQEVLSLRYLDSQNLRNGKLLASQGKSRYINSNLWQNLGEDEMHQMSEDEDEDHPLVSADPLTGAFMGYQMNLLQYHPTYMEALVLWKAHMENVEPLCKILHIPSTSEIVERVTQQPELATKTEECVLFAIYHFAIFSMTDEECRTHFGHERDALLQTYNFATRQALVNASFLKTSEIAILQALTLFLIPCRFSYDAHTYWILTGVAIRIAQRIGLHRDGDQLGFPPFEVQIRRRIFYQLIPVDSIAAQISGTGIAVDSWDTDTPLNVNDSQIWPSMTEQPVEQNGATDMIFCLARYCVAKYFAKPGTGPLKGGAWPFKDYIEAETTIAEAEAEVEEKYIRYCDVINPLHFLTICQARSAITAMRLRIRLPKVRNNTATDADRKEIFKLAQKIIDTDTTACANTGLRRYHWHIKQLFAWGSWDSIIFVLTSIRKIDLLTTSEKDAAWALMEQVFHNRTELLESKRALHVAVGRLALNAWDANPASNHIMEPAFISSIRFKHETRRRSRMERQASNATSLASFDTNTLPFSSSGTTPSSDATALLGSLTGDMADDLQIGNDFNIGNAEWLFWDHLIQDYNRQGIQQQQMPVFAG